MQSCRASMGSVWVPVDILYLQRATRCSRRRLWALAFFSFRETDLPQSPGWQHWTPPCFQVSWLIKVKLFVAHLLAPEGNEPGWGEAICIHTHQSQQRGFHVCLKLLCSPKKPSARSMKRASCHASEHVGWITAVHSWQKEHLSVSPGGIPSLTPLSGTCNLPWPAAAWQMHLTGC